MLYVSQEIWETSLTESQGKVQLQHEELGVRMRVEGQTPFESFTCNSERGDFALPAFLSWASPKIREA